MNDSPQKLYDFLTAKGFDLGTPENYEKKIKDPESRIKLYNFITARGYDLGDYKTYEQKLVGKPSAFQRTKEFLLAQRKKEENLYQQVLDRRAMLRAKQPLESAEKPPETFLPMPAGGPRRDIFEQPLQPPQAVPGQIPQAMPGIGEQRAPRAPMPTMPVPGEQPQQRPESLSITRMPKQTIFQKIKRFGVGLLEDSPEMQKAKAYNILAISDKLLKGDVKLKGMNFIYKNYNELFSAVVNFAEKNYDKLLTDPKIMGLRREPTYTELMTAAIALPVTAKMVAHPLSAAVRIGGFMALSEIENAVVSKVTSEDYKFLASKRLKKQAK